MKTTLQCLALFSKETLYEAITVARTTAVRFIVRARNIATNEECIFFVNAKLQTITKQ